MGVDHKEKIKGLPGSPGVYIMKDAAGAVLYVGKAANVRKRVASYFYPNRRLYGRLESMVGQVDRVDCVPTATEAEALVYENSLIKQLKPKYNVLLRDDKSYPRLKLTVNEKFPRLFITRKKLSDGALYYGPYTGGLLLREALIALRQMFPLRSCGKMAGRPCLNYHLHQCLAPCAGLVGDAAYAEMVSELRTFLEKGRPGLIKALTEKMLEASKAERFEDAAKMRARIEALSSMKEKAVRYIPADETEELRSMLGLQGPVEAIEAFDVSNIMGTEAVGSMIYFYNGRPRKGEYRKFRIKTVAGADDYSMMREIVRRRYERSLEEKKRLPDLIVIDGGKGHLAVVLEELGRLGIAHVPAIGIAKEFEHIYMKGRAEPLILPKDSKALHLLERIRDEAHRFAITYHKGLRSRKIEFSELDEIRGIGRKRKAALLARFGSVDNVRAAGLEELLRVDGIDEKSAKNIIGHFRK
jgi:excinuclease ABC subunit C